MKKERINAGREVVDLSRTLGADKKAGLWTCFMEGSRWVAFYVIPPIWLPPQGIRLAKAIHGFLDQLNFSCRDRLIKIAKTIL